MLGVRQMQQGVVLMPRPKISMHDVFNKYAKIVVIVWVLTLFVVLGSHPYLIISSSTTSEWPSSAAL